MAACGLRMAAADEQPAPRRFEFTTADGVRLNVLEAGPAQPDPSLPVIVLVPGWCMPASIWQPQLDALGQRFRTLAMDPRGQGDSDVPAAGYEAQQRASDLREVLAPLPRVVLVGWSLAVLDALNLVHQFGDSQLAGLVLVDNSVGEPPAPKPSNFISDLRADRSGTVDIAIIQSTHGREGVKDFVTEYGHVIVDECHHLSAFTFEQVMKQVKARYVLGLTATPERKDGHHPIIYMQCGPIRHKVSARSMTAAAPFEHEVIPRLTEFCLPPEQVDTTIQEVYAALADDRVRNELILADLLCAVGDRRSTVESERGISAEYAPVIATGSTGVLACTKTRLTRLD